MDNIERRRFTTAAAVGGLALSVGGSTTLLAPNAARAQTTAPSWPNRRLLDLLNIDHPVT